MYLCDVCIVNPCCRLVCKEMKEFIYGWAKSGWVNINKDILRSGSKRFFTCKCVDHQQLVSYYSGYLLGIRFIICTSCGEVYVYTNREV